MSTGMIPLDEAIVSKIVMTGDISALTDPQRAQYLVYRCKMVGIDPAGMPFNLISQKQRDGSSKLVIYANKECSAQLANNRKLSAVCVKEEMVDGGIYKVTYRVEEGDRKTEDCGTVSLMYWDKDGSPKGWKRLEGEGLSNAIMKCHTKAKRRAILTHCGLGMNDESEDIGGGVAKEEVKAAQATVKDPAKEAEKIPLVVPEQPLAEGGCGFVEELPGKNGAVWKVTVGAADYMTKDPILAEAAKILADRCAKVQVRFEAQPTGKLKLLGIAEVANGR